MIVRATVLSPRNGKLFSSLLEWKDDLKCYEVLLFEAAIGQRFVSKRYVSDVSSAPEFNLS